MRFSSGYIVVCTDMDAFRAAVPDITDVESSLRGLLEGVSGAFTKYSDDGTKSMKLMSTIAGVEHMAELPFIHVICLEDVFGYTQQQVIEGVAQWTTESGMTEGHFKTVPTGEYVDGDPIYVVERVETPTTRTVTDMDGVETEVAGRPIVEYITTDVIDGYQQVAVTEQVWVEPEPYTRDVPVYEDVPAVPEAEALYRSVYDYTATDTDEEGNEIARPKLFVSFGAESVSHINA